MGVSVLSHIALAAQLSLGIVFLLSALPKLRRPLVFAHSVVEYRILPAGVAYVFGLALIPLEIFLALAFLMGWRTDVALPVATAMLTAFLVAVGINLRRGRQILCGCFGNVSERISPRTLARLLLLLTVVLFLVAVNRTGEVALPRLGSMVADGSTFVYLLQSASLAGFLLLLAAWLLNLPELVLVVRHLREPRPASGNPNDGFKAEGA